MNNQQKKIKLQAAHWFARMQNAEPDHPERGKFETWLMNSELHAAAYSQLSMVWGRFDNASALNAIASAVASTKKSKNDRSQKLRRRLTQGLAGMVLITVASIMGISLWSEKQPILRLASTTEIGQVKKQILEDGSELTLNSDSELSVSYYRNRREVHLLRGEVIFNVAKDPKRPFIIDSEFAKVTVLGTRFVVNKLNTAVRISVDHGRVQIESPQSNEKTPLVLTDGQVAEISPLQLPRLINRSAIDAFGFEQGTISFEEADLNEVAEVLSRHYYQPIHAIPSHKNIKVTALVQIKNIDGFLQTLPRIADVQVKQENSQTILSTR